MATGDHFQLGELNGAGDTTILHGEASEDGSQDFNGKALLIVEPDTSLIRQVKHACHGIMTRGRGAGDGVFAESENGDGVFGSADGATSSGVRGESRNGIGVQGVSRNDNGVVGRSTRAAGVFGSSGIGVFGECTAVVTIGVGVQGVAKVANNPSVIGVQGLSSEGRGVVGETDKNTAVEGKSTSGVGIYGHSVNNRGGAFESHQGEGKPVAQLRLVPPRVGPDQGLPRDGQAGDFFVARQGGDSDLVALWFCIASAQGGQTALWGQVAFSQTRNA